jgi:hypothetical protein
MAKSRFDGQSVLPCTPADMAGMLRRKAEAPILAPKPQKPCDIGLFSDEADQLDLVEMFQDSAED